MKTYFAPMEGLTDAPFRRLHREIFAADHAPDAYFAPFLTPSREMVLNRKNIRDILPENNVGVPLVPQLLGNDADSMVWMIGVLRELGYSEVNLNFGCPSGTVTTKGKGAGILRQPERLHALLDAVFSRCEGPISVKTRLGIDRAEEFGPILEIYNEYPIAELTIHPRVMRQLYRGQADRAAFAAYLPAARMQVCYNGDLTTAEQVGRLAEEFPGLSAVMVGRGLMANPALLRQLQGGAPLRREELRALLDGLYRTYTADFGGAKSAINRMKAVWMYALPLFAGSEALAKQLKKLREPWEYEVTVDQIFSTLEFRAP